MSIPPECQGTQDQLTLVDREVKQALKELEAADPNESGNLLQQLKALTAKLHDLQNSLADCIVDSHQLKTQFKGTATIKIANEQPGSSLISLLILLNGTRTVITLTSFPPIISNEVTVTKTSGGSGSYARGHIAMPLGLHFAVSKSILDSNLSVTLTTDPPGSPVTPEPFGAVTLVGSGILEGGLLGGRRCDLTISGTISQQAF
jgi:hypothetical protein